MSGAIYLKLTGIEGESTDADHKDEINITSWNWGLSQPTAVHSGKGTTTGRVSAGDLVIEKWMDKASANLMLYCCEGKVIDEGILTVQRAATDKVPALVVTLENIIVSSYVPGGKSDSGTLPKESLSLSFKNVKFSYTPQSEKGVAEAAIDAGWDFAENMKL